MTKARDLANGGFGLVLVKPSTVVNGTDNGKGTVSFSAASTVSLNGVFSANYTNYSVIIEGTRSTNNIIYARYRASGSDNSTATYGNGVIKNTGGTPTVSATATNDAQIDFLGTSDSQSYYINMSISNPFIASNTLSISSTINGLYSTQQVVGNSWGRKADTTSYDGITFYPSTGTITGTISVYGYNK